MPYMNGHSYNPFYHYDPWIMFMMMNQNNQREEDVKPEDLIKQYKVLQEAFTPKKEEKKEDKKDKWEFGDYFLAITFLLSSSTILGTWLLLSKIIELMHALPR